jgi:hypothetical protein
MTGQFGSESPYFDWDGFRFAVTSISALADDFVFG